MGTLLASPTGDVSAFKAKASQFTTPNQSELIILINRAELSGFRHYAAAMKAALTPPLPIEAVQHPRGGYTHAVPQGNGSYRIYRGWWSTMAKAIAALPLQATPSFSQPNPESTC